MLVAATSLRSLASVWASSRLLRGLGPHSLDPRLEVAGVADGFLSFAHACEDALEGLGGGRLRCGKLIRYAVGGLRGGLGGGVRDCLLA